MAVWAKDRTVLKISGADSFKFLQDLITNDLNLAHSGCCYSALLNAQGKFLVDFFVTRQGEDYLMDAPAAHASGLLNRLNMYKLRAKVVIEETGLIINRGIGPAPVDAQADPRHAGLGWRQIARQPADPSETVDFLALRVAHSVPKIDIELQPNSSYILELGFERLNGVDFKKGCYVGQEVTARMHHKTQLRKGLMKVQIDGCSADGQ